MSKFSVGDRVIIVREDPEWCRWAPLMGGTLGMMGVVEKLELPWGDAVYILLDSYRAWWYPPHCIEAAINGVSTKVKKQRYEGVIF